MCVVQAASEQGHGTDAAVPPSHLSGRRVGQQTKGVICLLIEEELGRDKEAERNSRRNFPACIKGSSTFREVE